MIDTLTEPYAVLGVQLNGFKSYDHATETIRQRIRARLPTFCVAINPEKVYRAARDAKLKSVLDRADVRICDGTGVALASLLLERRRLPRCTGIELFMRLIQASTQEGWRIFLLGASPESNAAACRKLLDDHPGLKIVGTQHGFFAEPAEVVDRINQSGADLLFVAMGSPRQEILMRDCRLVCPDALYMGVGGTYDVFTGHVKRAPKVWQNLGLEWLYRLLSQPTRIKRQIRLLRYLAWHYTGKM